MRIKLFIGLCFALCSPAFAGERLNRCLISGVVASDIKTGFRNDIEWISEIRGFELHLLSINGSEANSKKWCVKKLQSRKDSKGNIKVTIDDRRESSPVLKKGMHLTLIWTYIDAAMPVDTFFIKAGK